MSEPEEHELSLILSVPVGHDQREDLIKIVRNVSEKNGFARFDFESTSDVVGPIAKPEHPMQASYAAAIRQSDAEVVPVVTLLVFKRYPDMVLVQFRKIHGGPSTSALQQQISDALYERWPGTDEIPITPGPADPPDTSELR